jgi:16S rRNA (guanine966-N2)-methyltransferase
VFNWLAPWIDGARCLDLFAGSGALGFEALSRGAAEVILIDDDPAVIAALQASARALDAVDCTIRRSRALDFLRSDDSTWDIVFLDPPFASDLLERTLLALEEGPQLHPESIVYVESSAHDLPNLDRWQTVKTTRTGDVQSTLVTRRD